MLHFLKISPEVQYESYHETESTQTMYDNPPISIEEHSEHI